MRSLNPLPARHKVQPENSVFKPSVLKREGIIRLKDEVSEKIYPQRRTGTVQREFFVYSRMRLLVIENDLVTPVPGHPRIKKQVQVGQEPLRLYQCQSFRPAEREPDFCIGNGHPRTAQSRNIQR